ncbi:hypothetical protein FB451DRAFT_1390192 [Mycena latifolia]|nr:hypothetical protein FB451DRAFT_1390192 [Mycena latifolia]
MPDFPQELIDAIIDEVQLASRPTLAACSLTAAAFVTSSQRRLFWGISISNLGAYERTAIRLAESPHLGAYVRDLALDIKELPKDCPPLKAILPLLPGVERLSIVGNANAPLRNPFEQNPCLIDFISLSSLRCLALDHLVDVPSSLIWRAFSSLEQVSLSCLALANQTDQEVVSPPPTGIRHLRVSQDAFILILPFVLHPTQLPHLQHLTRLSIVFSSVSDELKHLSLEPATSFLFCYLFSPCAKQIRLFAEIHSEAPFDLPRLLALSSLELWLDVDLVKTPLLLATIVSQTAAAGPHLEALTLAFMDRPKRLPDRQFQWTRSAAEWTTLDSALMDMRHLQKAIFSLRHFLWNEERYAAFVPYIGHFSTLALYDIN